MFGTKNKALALIALFFVTVDSYLLPSTCYSDEDCSNVVGACKMSANRIRGVCECGGKFVGDHCSFKVCLGENYSIHKNESCTSNDTKTYNSCEVDDWCENGSCFLIGSETMCQCRIGYYGLKCDKHINDYLGLCENNCIDSDMFCYKEQENSTYCSSITKVLLNKCGKHWHRNCTTAETCLVFLGDSGLNSKASCETPQNYQKVSVDRCKEDCSEKEFCEKNEYEVNGHIYNDFVCKNISIVEPVNNNFDDVKGGVTSEATESQVNLVIVFGVTSGILLILLIVLFVFFRKHKRDTKKRLGNIMTMIKSDTCESNENNLDFLG